MKKIFIASPYANGDVVLNIRRHMDAADELIELGFAPFIPLLYHFLKIVHPRPEMDWMMLDREWLYVCDAVLRLPGESKGADDEVTLAKTHGIPVFYSIDELEKG